MTGSAVGLIAKALHVEICVFLHVQGFHFEGGIVAPFALQADVLGVGLVAENYRFHWLGVNNITTMLNFLIGQKQAGGNRKRYCGNNKEKKKNIFHWGHHYQSHKYS
jgi:hypothetical protein